jgi:hypothetical protein
MPRALGCSLLPVKCDVFKCCVLTGLCDAAARDVDKLNEPAVVSSIGNFINRLAEVEAVSVESAEAEKKVWQRACELWSASGGCEVSLSVLKQLHERHTPNSISAVW